MTDRELFEATRERPPAERAAFLNAACADDASLRERIETLLTRHEEEAIPPKEAAFVPEVTGPYQTVREDPGTMVGSYKLLQRLGEGGFGVVYMAEQEKPVRRTVALKILKAGLDTAQVVARFESERQALALMDHPHIAKVLDAGTTDTGRPYFVMELVKGIPITAFCDQQHMPTRERLKLFVTVCRAIQHAHQKGIIHRDIKPSNVLVTQSDGAPVVKVIDFGVAKATVQKLTDKTLFTAHGQMIGTPLYMSPEQAEASALDIDTRSDIYSLGVLLFELLTGTTPLEAKRLRQVGYVELQRLIREAEAPRPSTRLSSLGDSATVIAGNRGTDRKQLARLLAGDLDWIVLKALEKDRNRRYSTPDNFAEDVERYLRHEAILARPPSTLYKLRKFVRRNRVVVAAAALLLVSLVGGIIGTTLGMIHAGRAEKVADAARKETLDSLLDLTSNEAIVGDLLSPNPEAREVGPVERAFFGRVVERFERLAAALPDTAENQSLRARCLSQVGSAHFYLGDDAQAGDAYRRAVALYRGLHEQSPDDPDAAARLISCLSRLALTSLRLGRKEAYDHDQAEALALAEEYHRRFPDVGEITDDLGALYQNEVINHWNDRTAYLPALDRAIVLLEKEVGGGRQRAGEVLASVLNTRVAHYTARAEVDKIWVDTNRVRELNRQFNSAAIALQLCNCINHLGGVLTRADRPWEAITVFREAVPIVEQKVAANPGSVRLRELLVRVYDGLQEALRKAGRAEEADRYQRLVVSWRERELKTGWTTAALYGELAERSAVLAESAQAAGRTDEANAVFGRALEFGRRLRETARASKLADDPNARDILRGQAWHCRNAGLVAERLQRWPESIEFHRLQLELAEAASAPGERLSEDLFKLKLSGNLSLAIAYAATGQTEPARPAWEETLRLAAWSDPSVTDDWAWEQLGKLLPKLTAAGKSVDPATVLAPELAKRRAELKAKPTATDLRFSLRRAYRILGLIYEKSGQYAAGADAYEQLLTLGPYPSNGPDPQARKEHTLVQNSLFGRAFCLDAVGREAQAEAAWKAVYKFTRTGPVNWYRARTLQLSLNGQPERAVRMADERLHDADNDLESYKAACVYSLASASPVLTPARKEELARRAVALLDKSHEAGFFDDPNQLENARKNPDLDPLRGRDDFKKRMAAWQAGKAKERDK